MLCALELLAGRAGPGSWGRARAAAHSQTRSSTRQCKGSHGWNEGIIVISSYLPAYPLAQEQARQ